MVLVVLVLLVLVLFALRACRLSQLVALLASFQSARLAGFASWCHLSLMAGAFGSIRGARCVMYLVLLFGWLVYWRCSWRRGGGVCFSRGGVFSSYCYSRLVVFSLESSLIGGLVIGRNPRRASIRLVSRSLCCVPLCLCCSAFSFSFSRLSAHVWGLLDCWWGRFHWMICTCWVTFLSFGMALLFLAWWASCCSAASFAPVLGTLYSFWALQLAWLGTGVFSGGLQFSSGGTVSRWSWRSSRWLPSLCSPQSVGVAVLARSGHFRAYGFAGARELVSFVASES